MYHLAFDDLLGSHLLLSIWSISRLFTPSPTEVVSLSNRSTIFRKELGKVCRGGANYIMPNQSLHSAKHLSWQLCHSEVLSRMESEFCFMISISLLAPVKGQTWRPAALTDTLLTLTEPMFPLWLPILSAAGMHSYCLLSLKLWAEHLYINSALDTRADFAQSMVGLQQAREDVPSACEICSAHSPGISSLLFLFLHFVCVWGLKRFWVSASCLWVKIWAVVLTPRLPVCSPPW